MLTRFGIASSYCIVFDTVIEDLPPGSFPTVLGMLVTTLKLLSMNGYDTPRFEIDKDIDNKLLISVVSGYLRRIA